MDLKYCTAPSILGLRVMSILTIPTIGLLIVLLMGEITLPFAVGQQSSNVKIVFGASNSGSGHFFEPPQGVVVPGTTVIWTNNDNVQHTVTSFLPTSGPAIVFDSNQISPNGGTFAFRFDQVGTYNYYCKIYPFMTGQIVVR